MFTRIITSSFIIVLLITADLFAQKATFDKPLNDGTGKFAQKVGTWFEGPDASVEKSSSIGPFVTGLYGFKTLSITNLAIGKLESMHINICRIMLGLYDNELDAHLKVLIDKGAKADGFYYPSETETADVQNMLSANTAANTWALRRILSRFPSIR
jgi:hypothetical protein